MTQSMKSKDFETFIYFLAHIAFLQEDNKSTITINTALQQRALEIN